MAHLLVIADSLAFHGPERAVPPSDSRLYPQIAGSRLGMPVDLVARQGWTARDGWWALTKDPMVWGDYLPRAGALLIGVGGMDQLPTPVPTWLRESIPYLRHSRVRRTARDALRTATPPLARRVNGPFRTLPQAATDRYLSRMVQGCAHCDLTYLSPCSAPRRGPAPTTPRRAGTGLLSLLPVRGPPVKASRMSTSSPSWPRACRRATPMACTGRGRCTALWAKPWPGGWGNDLRRPARHCSRHRCARLVGGRDGGPDRRSIERWAKPAVMVFLIAAALLIPAESSTIRWAIVIGLAFGLVGDVLLFYDRFIPGAAAFLAGHIAYVVALLLVPQEPRGLLVGGVIVLLVAVFVGRQIVAGAWRKSSLLGAIVATYMLVIGVVVVLAVGSTSVVVEIAALLFLTSDALLAWARFVGPAPGGRVAVMVTYQLAQAGFVLAIPTLGS